MVSRYILVAVFLFFFFSLSVFVVCVRTTRVTDLSVTVFLFCVSVVCIRTSLCFAGILYLSVSLLCVYARPLCP